MDETQLRKIPLFAQLEDAEAAVLLGVLKGKSLNANEALFWVGDHGQEFYIIESGRINITFPDQSGAKLLWRPLKRGIFLGKLRCSMASLAPRRRGRRAIRLSAGWGAWNFTNLFLSIPKLRFT